MDSLFGFIGNSEEKYRKKLEKMSDREFMDEYYKYSRTEKKGGALFSEMNRRRTEGGHSEEIFRMKKPGRMARNAGTLGENNKFLKERKTKLIIEGPEKPRTR